MSLWPPLELERNTTVALEAVELSPECAIAIAAQDLARVHVDPPFLIPHGHVVTHEEEGRMVEKDESNM